MSEDTTELFCRLVEHVYLWIPGEHAIGNLYATVFWAILAWRIPSGSKGIFIEKEHDK